MEICYEDSSRRQNRALLIPEILRLIIRHLHPISDQGFENTTNVLDDLDLVPLSKATTRALARVALVCTHFAEHALDYLWWFTNDLTPLFRVLPAFQPATDIVKVSLVDGDIHATDLQRFNSYAYRIRGYRMSGKEHFHPSTIARILRECNRSYLLPALQNLVVDRLPVAVLAFIPPSLQIFAASSNTSRSNQDLEIYLSISSLPRITQDIRCLTLFSNLSGPSLTAITRLTRLDDLSIGHRPGPEGTHLHIDVTAILQMASANTLRKLRLVQNIRFISSPASLTGQEITTFSSLESLEITTGAPTIRTLNNLLRSTLLPQLKTLVVNVPTLQQELDGEERRHWQTFFQILPGITSKKMKQLSFHSEGYPEYDLWSSLGLSIKDIPGLGLLNLTHLEVGVPMLSSISMSCLRDLVLHCPDLRLLNLGFDCKPLLDLHALVFLAQNLPYLEDLMMALPAESHVPIAELPILDHGLRDIVLVGLKAPHPREFVRRLDRLFPRLVNYELHSEIDENQESWDDASELLDFFQDSRRDQIERQFDFRS